MKKYAYSASGNDGNRAKGMIEAMSTQRAVEILRKRGLYVTSLKEKKQAFDINSLLAQMNSVSGQEMATFTRVLGTMVRTGLPLTDALESLATEMGNLKFKRTIEEVNKKIQGGSSLAAAMETFPDVFSDLYTSLIKVGETSGSLDKVLKRLTIMLERSENLKSKIRSALIYPAVIALVMVAIGALMMIMVIPKIGEVYTEMDAELPLPTKIMVSISDLLINYWWILLFAIPLVFVLFSQMKKKNRRFEFFFNNFILKVPIFGGLQKEGILALFTRTLGILMKSGVSILKALRITAKTLGNNIYQEEIVKASTQVEKGVSLTVPLQGTGLFPGIFLQLVSSGEETGTIDESLLKLADYFDEGVERKVKNLTSVLEPVMIVIMGSAVAGMAIAVLLPMFNLVNVIQ